MGHRLPTCIPSLHPLPLGLSFSFRPCISRHAAPCVMRLHPADYSIGKGAYWVTIRQMLDWMRNPVPASQLKFSMAMCGRAPPPPPPSAPLPSSGINITLILEGAALLPSLLLRLLRRLLLLLLPLFCRAACRWCACPGGAYCRRHLRWRY